MPSGSSQPRRRRPRRQLLLAANGGNRHESNKQLEKTYGHLVDELTKATMEQAQRLLDEGVGGPTDVD